MVEGPLTLMQGEREEVVAIVVLVAAERHCRGERRELGVAKERI